MILLTIELDPVILPDQIAIDVYKNSLLQQSYDSSSFSITRKSSEIGSLFGDSNYSIDINRILADLENGEYQFVVRDSMPSSVGVNVVKSDPVGFEFKLEEISVSGSKFNITGWSLGDSNNIVYFQQLMDDGFVYIKVTSPIPLPRTRGVSTGLNVLTFVNRKFDDIVFDVLKVSRATTIQLPPEPEIIVLEPSIDKKNRSRRETQGSSITGSYDELKKYFTSSVDRYHKFTDVDRNDFTANFSDYKNFVFFGSAEKTFQIAYNKLTNYYNASQSLITGSASFTNVLTQSLIDKYSEFTSYEKWLFNNKDGWPKSDVYSHSFHTPSSTAVQTWYSAAINTGSIYDTENEAYLKWNVPAFYFDYDSEDIFQNLIDMMGAFFDEIKLGIDHFSRLYHNALNYWDHAPDRMMKYVINSLGLESEELYASEEFYKYLLGAIDKSGVVFQSTVSLREIMAKFYVSLFNNLPYLIKSKGSKESLNILFNIFGISSTIFKPKEYIAPTSVFSSPIYAAGRIAEDRMFHALQFGSGSATKLIAHNLIPYVTGGAIESSSYTYETQIKWPSLISHSIPRATMSLWCSPLSLSSNVTAANALLFAEYATASYVGTSSYNHVVTIRRHERNMDVDGLNYSLLNVPIDYNKFYTVYLKGQTGSLIFTETVGIIERTNDLITLHNSSSAVLAVDFSWPKYSNFVHNAMTNSLEFGGRYGITTFGTSSHLTASIHSMKFYNQALSASVLESHALDYRNIYGMTTESTKRLVAWYRMNEKFNAADTTSLLDSSPWNNRYLQTASIYNFTGTQSWNDNYDKIYVNAPPIDVDLTVDEKIFIDGPATASTINSNRVSFTLSPFDEVNKDIVNTLGNINFSNYQIQPIERYKKRYKGLDSFRDMYFEKFESSSISTKTIDVESFFKLAKELNTAVFRVAERLLPERTNVEKGVVIKSTLFEKPKQQTQLPTIKNINVPYGEIESVFQIQAEQFPYRSYELFPTTLIEGNWQTASFVELKIRPAFLTGSITQTHYGPPTFTTGVFDYYNITQSDAAYQGYKFQSMHTIHKQLRYAMRLGSRQFTIVGDVQSASSPGGILTVTSDINNDNLTFYNT